MVLDRILGVRQTGVTTPRHGWFLPMRATSGVSVDEETALTYSAVFSAVKVISETIALLPWRVFREDGNRRELLAGIDLDILLHRAPNDDMTSFQFREFLIASALLHGNGYAEIERSHGGGIIGLHPTIPSRVGPRR